MQFSTSMYDSDMMSWISDALKSRDRMLKKATSSENRHRVDKHWGMLFVFRKWSSTIIWEWPFFESPACMSRWVQYDEKEGKGHVVDLTSVSTICFDFAFKTSLVRSSHDSSGSYQLFRRQNWEIEFMIRRELTIAFVSKLNARDRVSNHANTRFWSRCRISAKSIKSSKMHSLFTSRYRVAMSSGRSTYRVIWQQFLTSSSAWSLCTDWISLIETGIRTRLEFMSMTSFGSRLFLRKIFPRRECLCMTTIQLWRMRSKCSSRASRIMQILCSICWISSATRNRYFESIEHRCERDV